MKITTTVGLTAAEYEDIKKAVKAELPFTVSVRYHKQQYAYGSIDIRPTKQMGWHWTLEQVKQVREFCNSHNFHWFGHDYDDFVFQGGFHYLRKTL